MISLAALAMTYSTIDEVENAIVESGPGTVWVSADGIENATVIEVENRPGGYLVKWERVMPHGSGFATGKNTCPIRTVAWWVVVNKATIKEK